MTTFQDAMTRMTAGSGSAGDVTLFERVRKLLGLRRVPDDQALVGLVEQRLDPDVLGRLKTAGITDDEIYLLIVPRRTLSHRRVRGEALSQDESDRAVRVARLTALAEQVFAEPTRAWEWLRGAKKQLQGRSPMHLMATEAGARVVEEMLYRIDEGLAA